MIQNDLLLRAARREYTPRTPVWLMRQAGRCDPAYRAVRERVDWPLERIFANPELVAEISLLPRRIGVDAIIIFQDILTPLGPAGAPFVFRPGPVLETPIRSASDLKRLRRYDCTAELAAVVQSLRLVRESLAGALPLLGFAGAPFTLACFLLEGRSPAGDPARTKALMAAEPAAMHALLDMLSELTADYLLMQIQAGADAVQLFESMAHVLTRAEYEAFAHPYQLRVLSRVSPSAPTILFVRDKPFLDLMAQSGAHVISIGRDIDLAQARQQYGMHVAFQGNVDNELLARGSLQEIDAAVRACLTAGGRTGHILNLSHGVLPETPFENVCRFVETCRTTFIEPSPC